MRDNETVGEHKDLRWLMKQLITYQNLGMNKVGKLGAGRLEKFMCECSHKEHKV